MPRYSFSRMVGGSRRTPRSSGADAHPDSSPAALDAADALETLVHQFADPLSFFRELIQNAIDAGSLQVDIALEYREPDGVSVIRVDDFGEGMDRQIIDTKLTRLFSSTKDDDLTKIGRFGIGFVSVFALRPDAVCVDTSRGGESWRVLFRRDRSFVRIVRDTPVDGTKIAIFKTQPRAAHDALVERSRQAVVRWARYVKAELRFQGEMVNEPFDIAAPCTARAEEQGTEVVAGYPEDGSTFAGFYNGGLTLLEESQSPFPGVAFRINSRWLEHTLTRDNVIRDAAFDKALALVRKLVEGPLRTRLLDRLEAESATDPPGPQLDYLYRTAARQVPWKVGNGRRFFRTPAGSRPTLGECRREAERGRLYRDDPRSPVGAALEREGNLVLALAPGGAADAACPFLVGSVLRAGEQWFLVQAVEPGGEPAGWPLLRPAVAQLLESFGARVSEIVLARFDYPGSGIAQRVALTPRSAGKLAVTAEALRLEASWRPRRRPLVVNADHPAVRRLAALAANEPELAAYLVAKLFLLHGSLDPDGNSRLTALALEERWRRRRSA
jgi:molecular chaperone HtpG